MACNCGSNRPSARRAATAATSTTYEVLNASGAPTGQTYSSLVAAERAARAIGGSTRPK